MVKADGQVSLAGLTIMAKKGATIFHSVYLGMDNNSNFEVGIIQFPNGKTMGGQTVQAIYEITLRKEFL